MSQQNEGIIVTGGSFTAGQVSVGRNSRAFQITYNIAGELQTSGKEEVAKAIAELLKTLEEHAEEIKDLEEVVRAVQQIAEEAKKERSNKITLKGLLNGIKDVVSPIPDIVTKVLALQEAIAVMMGLAAL